jgi:hypothetical protein
MPRIKAFSCMAMLTLVLTSACTSIGPVKSDAAQNNVASMVPAGDGAVELWSAGVWMPDQRGVPGFAEFMAGGMNVKNGVLVMTAASLLFAQWDKNDMAYHVMLRLPYTEIQEVTMQKLGRNRFIIVSDKNFRTHSIQATGSKGAAVDQKKTEEVMTLLSGKIPPSPPKPVK